jgi:hypothetical protein
VGEPHHALDRLVLALERSFDGAVGVVSDPSRYAKLGGAAARRVAEEDALDSPVDYDPASGQ